MVQVYKIITGSDMVKSDNWFQLADSSERLSWSTADPLNLRPQATRVVQDWNSVPPEVKKARTVKSFKNGYAAQSEIGGKHAIWR
jgi:hypothetical protein